MFSVPHSDIPAPGIPYDWSILAVYVNHYCLASCIQRQRKNIMRVWTPSFSPHLDILTYVILTRETVVSESERTEVFVKMLTSSHLLFSLSTVLRLQAFSLLSCFFCLSAPTESLA